MGIISKQMAGGDNKGPHLQFRGRWGGGGRMTLARLASGLRGQVRAGGGRAWSGDGGKEG